MIRTVSSWILILLATCSCSSSHLRPKENGLRKDSTIEIIDPIAHDNYEVSYLPNLTLPTELNQLGVNGMVVFLYELNMEGEINNVEIARLVVIAVDGDTIAHYVHPYIRSEKHQYPKNIQRYIPWLLGYARSVRFRAFDRIDENNKSSFALLVRF
jgi:hypothetical protein